MKLISLLTNVFSLFCRKRLRDWLKFFTHIALVILVLFTIASYFGDKVRYMEIDEIHYNIKRILKVQYKIIIQTHIVIVSKETPCTSSLCNTYCV